MTSRKNVPQTMEGVDECRDMCFNEGHASWGFECPHVQGGENVVICSCITSYPDHAWIDTSRCYTHNYDSGDACNKGLTGEYDRFSISSGDSIYFMGSGNIASIYSTTARSPKVQKTHKCK